MKSLLMRWAMSAVVAVFVTPGLRSLTPRAAAAYPTALAQADGPVAVPGSADAPGPMGGAEGDSDDQPANGDNEAGQAQPPEDPDAAQQPPVNLQQPPADDSGDDASTQQPSGDDEGAAPAPQSSGDDDN